MGPSGRSVTTSATSLRPLWDRAAEWECRLRMVAEAERFLYLSTYYLEFDAYGAELLTALVQAQERGVAVHLLIDGFGQALGGVLMSSDVKTALATRLDELRAAGATVVFYAPAHYLQRRLGGGQHVKIQVSDAGEAVFGSSNITASSFEHWHEYSVAVRGPVVPLLLASCRDIGSQVEDGHVRHLEAVAADSPGTRAADLPLDYWLCNPNLHQGRRGPLWWRGQNIVTDRLVGMLDAARHRVQITAFYFKPIPILMHAVIRAARRGVRVDVFHSHREALDATDLAWIAAATSYDRLLAAGVRLYEHRGGEHSKIVLVDSHWVAFGSYNFEDAAHDRLAEAMLATRDRETVAHAASIFNELRDDPANVPITRQFRRGLSRSLRWRLALMGRFKRWM
jgi:cardiolipin synthase